MSVDTLFIVLARGVISKCRHPKPLLLNISGYCLFNTVFIQSELQYAYHRPDIWSAHGNSGDWLIIYYQVNI